ncbi:MAG: alkanesulfonate monooxygenase [Candidatus Binatia bacterium]|jgi:alkanesulfonate monooxygenase
MNCLNSNQPLRFHWSLSQAGNQLRRSQSTDRMSGVMSFAAQLELCLLAENCGIESMLMAIGFTRPDPLALSVALGARTQSIKFMVACRAGLISPTLFVQQMNTLSQLTSGRVSVNMVAGHSPGEMGYYGDFLKHDERFERMDEFLAVCRAYWRNAGPVNFSGKHYLIEDGRINTPHADERDEGPEIYLGGNSELAAEIAERRADCLWMLAEAPEAIAPRIEKLLRAGRDAGILVALIARSTHDEAVAAAGGLIEELGESALEANRKFADQSDSVAFKRVYGMAGKDDENWVTPRLWAGAVPYLGAPSIALVGSFDEVADALFEYRAAGVSQFLFLGWPDDAEMKRFGEEILPRVRRRETREREETK